MTLIVCIDRDRGMTFFGKRQSADRVLYERILDAAHGRRLLMDRYSAFQFGERAKDICVVDDPAREAKDDDVVFVEDTATAGCAENKDTLIIYRWNKKYPHDTEFDIFPFDEGMRLECMTDLAGSSHERITEEIWVR